MDPMQPYSSVQPMLYPLFLPGIFDTNQDRDDYLSALDSDTRDYVIKHTDEFNSKSDLIECVNRLHGMD